MNRSPSPRAKFTVLLAVAAAALPAAALPPTRVAVIDDATLATMSGRYFGANMLVGVRVDLVSTMSAPQHGNAMASATLYVKRNAAGFDVQVASAADAQDAGLAMPATPATSTATGGHGLDVAGIAQRAQIAGDDNRLGNLALIGFVPASQVAAPNAGDPAGSAASAGAMSARVTFLDGGVQMAVTAPGASLLQQFSGPGQGRILQSGQVAGNGVTAANQLQLQVMTAAMPSAWQQQLGVLQAMNLLCGVPR